MPPQSAVYHTYAPYHIIKGINTPGQALDPGGVASSWAPKGEVSHLAFPALAREHGTIMLFPLLSLRWGMKVILKSSWESQENP